MAEDYQNQERFESPEDEIRALEQKLEAKKRELAERGIELPHEKEMFREVLREHVEEIKAPLPAYPVSQSDDSAPKTDDKSKAEEREEAVRRLIELALTSTIEKAVRRAEAETPYILDELHDHLIDDYYDKLVALRKIKIP
ncbi:MAG: hypothetical protein HYT98_02550 [Candidatus Sungbacteria bacterium]|nr:hypothetical protein [Candidatus Sungbacteria bacterium]